MKPGVARIAQATVQDVSACTQVLLHVPWSTPVGAAGLAAALRKAAGVGSVRICTVLVAKGADANGAGEDGRTPLRLAAEHGHAKVVALLLAAGAGPSGCNTNSDSDSASKATSSHHNDDADKVPKGKERKKKVKALPCLTLRPSLGGEESCVPA